MLGVPAHSVCRTWAVESGGGRTGLVPATTYQPATGPLPGVPVSYDPQQPQYPQQPQQPIPAYQPPGQQPPPQYAPPGQDQPYSGWVPPPPAPKKGWGAGKVTLVIVGGVLVLCVIGAVANAVKGGKATVSAPPSATTAKATGSSAEKPAGEPANSGGKTFNALAGSTMTVTADDGSVAEATLSGIKLHKGACTDYGAKPDNGSYLIVNVVVVQKKGTGSVNPLDFTFVGEDGTTSNALGGSLSGCTKNDLSSTNALRAGTKRSGQIAFDVKDTKGTIEYAPGGLGSEAVGSWKTS